MYDPMWLLFAGIVLFLIWAIYTLQEALWFDRYESNKEQYIVVIVANMENIIEGVMWNILALQQQMDQGTQIVVIDNNSKDKTLDMIKRFNYPNEFITILTAEGGQQVKRIVERYNKHDCLIIDYRKYALGTLQGISMSKIALRYSGKV